MGENMVVRSISIAKRWIYSLLSITKKDQTAVDLPSTNLKSTEPKMDRLQFQHLQKLLDIPVSPEPVPGLILITNWFTYFYQTGSIPIPLIVSLPMEITAPTSCRRFTTS